MIYNRIIDVPYQIKIDLDIENNEDLIIQCEGFTKLF